MFVCVLWDEKKYLWNNHKSKHIFNFIWKNSVCVSLCGKRVVASTGNKRFVFESHRRKNGPVLMVVTMEFFIWYLRLCVQTIQKGFNSYGSKSIIHIMKMINDWTGQNNWLKWTRKQTKLTVELGILLGCVLHSLLDFLSFFDRRWYFFSLSFRLR